ncbi:hypothetical protein M970_080400 [Encephalitozoon cuniculi EcunIII-L]|uniref:Uncharacterized protein n=1 Tax=Encephalitozoon cuniculi TaxID=6035 RepID=M1K7V0_ENCCN|nr:hypothetical protein ECU08_0430 [Encephalitozoon cuniculi]KMV65570.1 hypothetical protein M970_080400 [Encephalitozoon cuniculi EcunIII-L]
MEDPDKMSTAKENMKDFREKIEGVYKHLGEKTEGISKEVNIKGVEVGSGGIFGLVLVFTPVLLSIFGLGHDYLSIGITIIGYLIAIALSLLEVVPKLQNIYKEYQDTGDVSKLFSFKSLMLLFQAAFAFVLLLHFSHIADKNRAKDTGIYGLMISMVYISRQSWKLSNFSIKNDDFYKFIVCLTALVMLLFMTTIAWKDATTSYTIACTLLSAVIILCDYIGKPISERLDEVEPLSAITALLLVFTVMYVSISASSGFKILSFTGKVSVGCMTSFDYS